MALTPEQYQTLNAAIVADPVLNAYPNSSDGNYDMCQQKLNVVASPAFIVWKGNVSLTDTGKVYNGIEWAAMTSANHARLQDVAQWLPGGYNAALSDIRAMFNDIWSGSGGQNTRVALMTLWKRSALLGEKILATGAGTDAAPATLGYDGKISAADVAIARGRV